MPTQRVEFSGAITDGDAIINVEEMYERHQISIRFFTDSTYTTLVDKSTMSGSVTFTASEFGDEFGDVSNNGVLTLGVATYARPDFSGSVRVVKAAFTSVVGATHYKILISSFAG